MEAFVIMLGKAARRAYSNGWTAALILFELSGAALLGMHARTASVWPFLVWLLCAPFVRFFYLHKLHKAGPVSWREGARMAYGLAGLLLFASLVLVGALLLLFSFVRRLSVILGHLGHDMGFWAVVAMILLLAFLLVAVTGALLIWAGLATMTYAKAVIAPATPLWGIMKAALRLVLRRAGLVLGVTCLQGLFVLEALGAQLLKKSGVALTGLVWPAALFAPVALAFLLSLTEKSTKVDKARSLKTFNRPENKEILA